MKMIIASPTSEKTTRTARKFVLNMIFPNQQKVKFPRKENWKPLNCKNKREDMNITKNTKENMKN